MFKSIFKVMYIGFAIVLAVLVYVAGYNTNIFDHIGGLTNQAINDKNYVEVAKIHGACFETKNIVTEQPETNKNNYELAVFKSSIQISEQIYVDEKTEPVTENGYDYSYYIYLFGLTDVLDQTTDGETLSNETAFNFVGTEGTYTYYFKVSKDYNSTFYTEKPKNINEALLGKERDLFSYQINWGFVNLTLTETLLKAMNIGTINQIEVTNASGNVVFEQDVVLDFNKDSGFFADINPLIVSYNEYIDEVTAAEKDNEKINKANEKFETFYKEFEEKFLATEGYTFRHEDSYLQPGKLVWKTVGLLAFYVLAAAILYILIFNFAAIKNLFSKNSYSNSYGQRAVEKNKKEQAIDAKVEEIKSENE